MLIAQVTDIHIGFAPEDGADELNRRRLVAVLERIVSGPNRPDLLVLSGDLTEHGDHQSFADVAALVGELPVPTWPMVGNHDHRDNLRRTFPQANTGDPFVHHAIDLDGLRVLLLDTLEPGRHGGAFCEARARWLADQLDAHPDTPTLIFMHHPPIVSGVSWMDPAPNEPWIERFGAVVEGRRQIVRIQCGHLHRPVQASFRGIPLGITASVAPLVAMDLRSIDPARPDARDLITTEPPGYALHCWDGRDLVTHHEYVNGWDVLASYTEQLQPMIQAMFAERG
jgi:3',5'-cyclic-AMP phosphodiesterase